MNSNQPVPQGRQAAINGLAIVGFIALVLAGIWLALYSTRYVPLVVDRLGVAAVYLGSAFVGPAEPGLSVVPSPGATTTIPGSGSTTTPPYAPPSGAGGSTGGTAARPALYGLPDLLVTVSATGYLATKNSYESFVANPTIPANKQPAIRFSVQNIGTNTSAPWRFRATVPDGNSCTYESLWQPPLPPGAKIDYTLGYDRVRKCPDEVTITVNFDNAIAESNTANSTISLTLTIES